MRRDFVNCKFAANQHFLFTLIDVPIRMWPFYYYYILLLPSVSNPPITTSETRVKILRSKT